MSTRAVPSSKSNSNRNNNSMSSRRASGSSRRISESSASLGSAATTASTTSVNQTTATTTSTQQKQHVAGDKSAIKRKKRRKDKENDKNEETSATVVAERVPVVVLTRLEDERKSNESSRSKQPAPTASVKKVVGVARTDDNESIKTSSSEKSVAIGKRSTRHSVHRSSKNLASGDAKTAEPIVEEKAAATVVLLVEESAKIPQKKSIVNSKNTVDQAAAVAADSQSSKVKHDQQKKKPQENSAECNVNNVNNDNLKQIDPKIIERQLLVRLDRSQVENYLKEKRILRLHSEDKLLVETDKYHSQNENEDSDVPIKASKEIKTCAISSDAGIADQTKIQNDVVEQALVDNVTNGLDRVQPNTEEPVEFEVGKKKEQTRNKNKKVAKNVVKNQRLSTRGKRKVAPREIAGKCNKDDSDRDLRDNTKINNESSVQTNENQQVQRLDGISKDTSCESAKSHRVISRRSLSKRSERSLKNSAVIDSSETTDSSKKSKTNDVSHEIIESNSIDDSSIANDGRNAIDQPVQLPMELNDHSVVDNDSKVDGDSAQQTCDIHSKKVIEEIDQTTKDIPPESTETLAENFVDSVNFESSIENSMNSSISAKNLNGNEVNESSTDLLSSKTSGESTENSVNGEAVGSPTDSFMSCENAESVSGENNASLIETIDDTESSASTCTLIEETPEELSQNIDKELDAEEELSEGARKQSEVTAQDVPREDETAKDHIAGNDGNLKVNENLPQEDKIAENNEQESTFENNLKSVENLVIDSILNGEIVSPKIIAQSSASKVEEVQTFVFEGGVEDFVNDIEAPKETPASLEPSTPVEEAAAVVENLDQQAAPIVEESPVVETPEHACVMDAEIPVPIERPTAEETLPLPVAEQAVEEKSTTEKTVESPAAIEESSDQSTSTDKPVDEEFSKHRRKHTLSELKKKCTENIGKRYAQTLEKDCVSVEDEEPLPSEIFNESHTITSESQVPTNVLAPECFLEQTMVTTNESYLENISDAESEICLADRLNRTANLNIPSLEDSSSTEIPVLSEGDENSREGTKRQRILMKITKTDANKLVTHLVQSKEENEATTTTTTMTINEQFSSVGADQVTEGEIKIIMRKESNNHVIKEIKIIPRTPEGGNSARIPGYSPTSSDLSSGNSSCRVPSCSPAKPDSGSYRMPGWSPASTEMGQTTNIKKKQGRTKKYPIFTESELIAKTTAIVNNVVVHAEKPLFEPVESIRINENDEATEEEHHHTVVNEQMCLSGDQLLDAMPAKPEILAKYGRKIEESQNFPKIKKKLGRPRKNLPPDDDAQATTSTTPKVSEKVARARIEFDVVDSIEEFVEPAAASPTESPESSPSKKKGRGRIRKSRRLSQEDASAMGETDDDTLVTEADVHSKDDAPDDDDAAAAAPDAVPRVERRCRKPYKHFKNSESQLFKNLVTENAYSITENEVFNHDTLETEQQVVKKQRGRRSHKLEGFNSTTEAVIAEGETSMTENESANDASIPEPRLERRGRKPWKHLKNNVASSVLSENQANEGDTSMTENEDANDASIPKPRVERRGRKPWKHLKNNTALAEGETPLAAEPNKQPNDESVLLENQSQATDGETSMTENEDASVTKPCLERRRRKAKEHLKNNIASAGSETLAAEPSEQLNDQSAVSEHQATEGETSMTENEDVNDASVTEPRVERRGRKPYKHLKNNVTLAESEEPAAEMKKRVGRSRKNQPEANALFESQVVAEAEDKPIDDTPVIEPTVKSAEEFSQDETTTSKNVVVTESVTLPVDSLVKEKTSTIESENGSTPEAEVLAKKKRSCKSLTSLQDSDSLPNDAVLEENSMTEDDSEDETSLIERLTKTGKQQPIHFSNEIPTMESEVPIAEKRQTNDESALSENQFTEYEDSTTENLIASDAASKKIGRKPKKHLQEVIPLPEGEKKKRGRPRKIRLDVNVLTETQVMEEANSITEDEAVNDSSAVESEKRGSLQKSIQEDPTLPPNVVAESKNSLTEDETVSSTEDIPTADKQQGRLLPKSLSLMRVTFAKGQLAEEESSSLTEDETVSSTEDIPRVEPIIVKKNKPGRPRKIVQFACESLVPSRESLAASSADDAARMVPPIVVKRRPGRTPKNSLRIDNNSTAPEDTTEDETVSSTEDIPRIEHHHHQHPVVKRRVGRPRKIQPVPSVTGGEMSESFAASSMEDLPNEQTQRNSMAASSMEDLSTIKPLVPAKKRGRKPRSVLQDDSTLSSESMTASSMEDLTTLAPPTHSTKKRGRPPKNRSPLKFILPREPVVGENSNLQDPSSDSIEEFSPVKQLSPQKQTRQQRYGDDDGNLTPKVLERVAATLYQATFNQEQPVYDRSLSPVKRRVGRPPKYPRKEIDSNSSLELLTDESQRDSREQAEKRKGRTPCRLSQDENIKNDEGAGRSPQDDTGVPTISVLVHAQQNESDDVPVVPVSLGKRQGRPPRKFSPDEERNFFVLPQAESDLILKRPPGRPRKYSQDDSLLSQFSQSSISDSDESTIIVKKRGRRPKKFPSDDGVETIKRKGRPPKYLAQDDSLPSPPQSLVNDSENPKTVESSPLQNDNSPLLPAPAPIADNNQHVIRAPVKPAKEGATMSTTNLLRQQRKPRMSQPQQPQQQQVTPPPASSVSIVTAVETNIVSLSETLPAAVTPVKKRGRQPKLPIFDAQKNQHENELPDNLTLDQLKRRRHSQDDSMFSENLAELMKERSKEFEDAQVKRKRGRQPKIRELSRHFVMRPLKPNTIDEAIAQALSPNESLALKEVSRGRMGRPRKVSPEKCPPLTLRAIAPKPALAPVMVITTATTERTSRISAADYLRTWTDRDDSPGSQIGKNKCKCSQDDSALPGNFILGRAPRPLSRNRLRRYSQGDAVEQQQQSAKDDLLPSRRKRIRSSGSDDSLMQDEKRPRVEKELCDQHSITKELVVQLTKIDKPEETPAVVEPIRDIVKMNLRRKLESSGGSNSSPPPLVPIEQRIQPATHSDAKLLMLMQPSSRVEERSLQLRHPQPIQPAPQPIRPAPQPIQPAPQPIQPAPQQFCIIFIPDALTSAESSLSKDSQPTATIVNFQPVPDAELANKSVIYTPTTTPTKIFVNDEQHNRAFLCATCSQALDLIGRLEANVGMTEEDKCAIKCPYCSNDFQSLFYLEYHLRQEHLKCEKEKQCRHSGFNTLRIPSHDASSESEIYITFALKCRSCYALFENVLTLNEHVKAKHANLIRHKPPLSSFGNSTGMVCYPPPPFKNGVRAEVLHCPSDCICRIGIRSTDSPMQRAQVLKRCPNFMRRLEKIEAAAYVVYTCTLCRSTFLMKDEVVEHLMKMHEVSCKFPCTKCLISFRAVQLQESHHCSETTIRDLDKLINIVILPNTDKAHDNSKFEDSSNDELGPIKTTPPPAVPSASTPLLNGVKRKNGVVIQKLTKYLAMQPPKKPKIDAPSTPVTAKKRLKKTPCPKCQKKFAYRKSLNDHITFEHIIPCKKANEASKKMAIELLQLVNGDTSDVDVARIEELASALGKYTDDDGVSLKKLTMINDEQENWNEAKLDEDFLQCSKCKLNFKSTANSANPARRNIQQPNDSPTPHLCDHCDPAKRRQQRNAVVNNGHSQFNNLRSSANGEHEQQQVRYTYECDRCSRSYPTTIELNRHNSEEHGNKPSEALSCDICSKVFYSSRMLDKHKKMHDDSSLSNSRIIEDGENTERNNQSVGDVSKDSDANDTANSSTSRRDSTDNSKEEEKCKCPHCDFCAEKVSLKNHLKREHGVMAFICQFCGKLLVEISEVRHMLDAHIKSSRKNGNVGSERGQDEVAELLRTLGKNRLQSLMIYHDFEGKCNNAIMRCPICPEQFATRESCRHHYQWMHDSTCILCDASFSGGNVAGQHKVAVHNSIASYVWAIQRLVSAIVHSLRLDRAHPSHVLYQEVSMRLDMIEENSSMIAEGEQTIARSSNGKAGTEEASAGVSEPFLEPVVLSEDQLPSSGNMIEVVIGNDMVVEDSEDNLLENFYLSPNYESSCEQPKILDAGALISELEEEEEVVTATTASATTVAVALPTACTTALALPTTPSITTSSGGILIPTTPVTAETYATSAVFKLRQDNGQEEVVLAITDEDLVTYRDDIGSLAERLSATCDSLSLEEITTMLRSYFENVGTPQAVMEEVELADAIEPRTQ